MPKDFIHPRNKDKTDGISVFSDRKRKVFPDFYNRELRTVLDAKYKKLEFTEKGINREDLFQLISYSYILKAEQAGLVFPSEDKVIDNEIGKLAGYGDQLKKWSIQVPGQAESYQDFVKRIESFEKVFIENIGKDLKGKTNTG